MQTVSSNFTTRTSDDIRKIHARLLMSFTKTANPATRFFTVGISSVGVTDPIAPSTSTDINEWDKYQYDDYGIDRILDFEVTHEQDLLGSMIMGMADITLINTDDIFTPSVDVTIGDFVQSPKRPLRLYAGFNNDAIPLFTGITEKAPNLSETKRTAQFHALDFISFIADIPLTEAVMFIDKRIDEIISDLLVDHAGLSINQFVLDTGITVIPFAYFKKDAKLGKVIQQLCESELATFFEDEEGKLRLWNRQHLTRAPFTTAQWDFDRNNCNEIDYPDSNNVINVVEVMSLVREVQANQKLWELANVIEIPAGGSVDIFADFRDDYGDLPVISVDDPEYIVGATTSYYATNEFSDGTGATYSADITLDSTSRFGTAYKMVFSNDAAIPVYLTALELFAIPAKVVNEIFLRLQDSTSVTKYEEQIHTIENDFIQTQTFANSIAAMLIADRSEPSQVRSIEVTKGVPQLQIGDLVNFDDGNGSDTYTVQKKETRISVRGGLVQKLDIVQRTVVPYFTAGISAVGYSDVIAP